MHSFSPTAPICTFVMRFWVEWSGDSPSWQGSIEHLQSGNHASFRDLEEVTDFIRENIRISPVGKTNQNEKTQDMS